MRVLYLSRLQDVGKAESIALYAARQWEAVLKANPSMSLIWTVPRGTPDKDLEWLRDMLGERATFWEAHPKRGPRRIGSFTTEEVYDAFGQYQSEHLYDVVVTNQPQALPLYRTVMTHHMQQERYAVTTPVIAQQMWTATAEAEKESSGFYAGAKDVASEALGAFFADTNVWESEHLFRSWIATMRRYVQPAVLDEVLRNSCVIPMGFPMALQDEIRARRSDPTGVVMWGARWSASKRPEDTMKVLAATKCPVIVTSPDALNVVRQEWPSFECHAFAGPAEFVATAEQASAFVCMSRTESYGIGWLELLAAGVLGVFDDKPWVRDLLPEYPYVTSSTDDMATMARWMANNALPLERSYWAEFVRSKHRVDLNAMLFDELLTTSFRQSLEEDARLGRGSIAQQVDEALRFTGGGDEDLVWDAMTEFSSGRRYGMRGDPISRMYLRRIAQVLGWHDVGTGPRAEFRKEGFPS